MADPAGVPQVVAVAAAIVAVVVAAAALTGLAPAPIRDLVLQTPLAIIVLVTGTAAVLWSVSRPSRPRRPR